MSYISKMKQEIKNDIEFCEQLLKKDFVTRSEFSNIIGKYIIKYPDFEKGLKNYASSIGGKGPNEIENLKIVKAKLEMLLIEIENPRLYQKGENGMIINQITTNNTNNNDNNNSNIITINMSIEDVRKNINDNTYLGDGEKEELLKKLSEIEELQKSKESKVKKWNIAKGILSFILDKGVDIAIMYIPQILKAIQ